MFRVLAALSAVVITTASVIDSAELLPVPDEYKFHARPAHGISDPGSPWITGPKNNKYQFHIGRQSWLAAREHCLAQNSDLVVIEDAEELNWVLSHYAPALPHFIERLIQVGLYIDSHDGIREWHWTNHKSLNTSALAWISGEPFDHANGHERCAVLRVNAAALDDVDCDLPGSETKMYRFICQRSHEAHVKHEEVNNPLWKKLQDILDFFGISRPSGDNNSSENKTRPGEDEEDYWEMVKKENTTDVDNTLNATETTIAAIKEVIESVEVLEGSGEEVTDSVPDGTSAPVQTHGAKTSENAVIADELLINDSLQKINSAEEAVTTDAPAPLKKEEVIIETASVETTRTTKPDPLEKPTPKKPKDQIHYVDVLQKHMDKLEKIVNAVEHMIGPLTDDDSEEEGDLGEIAESKNDNNTEASIPEMAEIIADDMANMEEDFQEAALETKEHPGINGGDFVAVPNDHQENIELCENDEDETTPAPTRAQKIEKFLTSLQRFLNRSSNKKLKDLVDESKLKGKSLLEKIDEAVMEQTAEQLQKMIEVQGNLTDRVPHKKHESNVVTEKSSTAATTVKVEKVTEVTDIATEESTTTAAAEIVETTSPDAVETSTIAIQEVISKVTAEVELEPSPEANTEPSASDETTAAVVEKTTVTEKANAEETESTKPETTAISASPVEEVTSSATETSETEATTIANSESTESAIASTSEKPVVEEASSAVTVTSETESTIIAETKPTEPATTTTSAKSAEEAKSAVTETSQTESTTVVESTTANTPIAEEPLSKPEGSDNTITESGSTLAPAIEAENSTAVTDESVTAESTTSKAASIEESESSEENEPSNSQTVLQVTKENITEVSKKRSDQKNAEIKKQPETESLFPTPDFSLIKPGQGIPEDVLKSVQEEALKIGAAYEEFNRRMDTSKIVKHIQEKEANGVLKNKPLLDSLPLSSRTEKRDPTNVEKKALLELEKMFVDLGKNFQAISQG